MRIILFIYIALWAIPMTSADTVPLPVVQSPALAKSSVLVFDQGQLFIMLREERITEEIYGTVISDLCRLIREKEGVLRESGGINEVIVMNRTITQGMAFAGGTKECMELGNLSFNAGNRYLAMRMRPESCAESAEACFGRASP